MSASFQAKVAHLLYSGGNHGLRPVAVRMLHEVSLRALTPEQVVRLREEKASGATIRQLERRYGLSKNALSRICRGDTYKEVGGPRTVGRKRK